MTRMTIFVHPSVTQSFSPKPSGAFDHERVYLEQWFLVCRFMGCPHGEKWPSLPHLSIHPSVSHSIPPIPSGAFVHDLVYIGHQSTWSKLSGAFGHEQVHLGQRFLACRFMGYPQREKWLAWPQLFVHLSISTPAQNTQEHLTMNEFTWMGIFGLPVHRIPARRKMTCITTLVCRAGPAPKGKVVRLRQIR